MDTRDSRRCYTLNEALNYLDELDADEIIITPPTGNGNVTDKEEDMEDDRNFSDENHVLMPNDVCGELEVPISRNQSSDEPETLSQDRGSNFSRSSCQPPPKKKSRKVQSEKQTEKPAEKTTPRPTRKCASKPSVSTIIYEETESDEEESMPSTSSNIRSKKRETKKNTKSVPRWRNSEGFLKDLGNDEPPKLADTHPELIPLDCFGLFCKFYTNEIRSMIVEETKRYASQANLHDFQFEDGDLDKFIAIVFLTGYHSLPREKLYWSKAEDVAVPLVPATMPRARFEEMKRNLHFANNENLDGTDKLSKIKPLLILVQKSLQQFGIFSPNLSIDEQMIPYYGHHSAKMFMKGKPIRFGYKVWVMCSSGGYPYNFEVYTGKQQDADVVKDTLGSRVVKSMLNCVKIPGQHQVFFDNFFTSHKLMSELSELGFRATGTARENRLEHCPLPESNVFKKTARGTHSLQSDGTVTAVKWNDNRPVVVVSNYDSVEPLKSARRYSAQAKKQVEVPQPNLISSYNRNMGGVDLLDQNLSRYRPTIRVKKWYWPIAMNFISILRVAAWSLHKELHEKNEQVDQLEFMRQVVLGLLNGFPKPALRPGPIGPLVFLPNDGHIPDIVNSGKQGRCKICKKNTTLKCSICDFLVHVKCAAQLHE